MTGIRARDGCRVRATGRVVSGTFSCMVSEVGANRRLCRLLS